VAIAPIGLEVEVKSIEKHNEALQQAMAGENIGFNIKHVRGLLGSRGAAGGYLHGWCAPAGGGAAC
jgi:elongation factor 1-alpha